MVFEASRPLTRSVSSPSVLTSPKSVPTSTSSKKTPTTHHDVTPHQDPQTWTSGHTQVGSRQDLGVIHQKITLAKSRDIVKKQRSVPIPKSLRLHLSSSPTKTLQEALFRHGQLGSLGSGLGGIEKSLRSTFFKTRGQRKSLMSQAQNLVKQTFSGIEDRAGLLEYAKSASPKEVKDQLARVVGAMRADKYGTDATYSSLSSNKQALVDSMYKALMQETIHTGGDLVIPHGLDQTPLQPGVQAIAQRDIEVHDNGETRTIKKGEPCIFHERDGKIFIQRMVRNEKKKKGELGSWDFRQHMIEIPDMTQDGKTIKAKDLFKPEKRKFKTVTTPLFEGPVSPSDIRQGSIGDCFVIAPIYDLARRDPQAIHDMMKDNGDGTVTVKLYQKKSDGEFEPQYITVDKSIPDNDKHAEDTLWVQMLEKAFAVQQGSYDSITYGGQSHNVYESLLGVESTKHDMPSGLQTIGELMGKRIGIYENLPSVIAKIKAKAEHFGMTPEQAESLAKFPAGDLSNLFTINDFSVSKLETTTGVAWPQLRGPLQALEDVKTSGNPEAIEKAKGDLRSLQQTLRPLQQEIEELATYGDTQKALTALLQKSPTYKATEKSPFVKRDVLQTIMTELQGVKNPFVVDGKSYDVSELVQDLGTLLERGSFAQVESSDKLGVDMDYSTTLNQFFTQVQQDLSSGKHISVGSKETIGISTGTGHSGGESVVDGLAGSHAYAVLDTVEMNGRKFVKIANPWGNDFSRDYSLKDGRLVATEHKDRSLHDEDALHSGGQGISVNESWVELHELVNLFSSYYVTDH